MEKKTEKTTTELFEVMKAKKDYNEFFKQEIKELNFNTVNSFLETLLTQKKLNKAEVINKSNLNTNYAYQIFNGTKTNPGRDKILMLSFGMDLSLDETATLLKLCNLKGLYIRDPRDSIIMHSLMNHKSLMDTNELLDEYGLKILE